MLSNLGLEIQLSGRVLAYMYKIFGLTPTILIPQEKKKKKKTIKFWIQVTDLGQGEMAQPVKVLVSQA